MNMTEFARQLFGNIDKIDVVADASRIEQFLAAAAQHGRAEPPAALRAMSLHAKTGAIGTIRYRTELKHSSGGGQYVQPARVWVRGYDAVGRKCYECLIADGVDRRNQGPRSKCGKALAEAAAYAAELNG